MKRWRAAGLTTLVLTAVTVLWSGAAGAAPLTWTSAYTQPAGTLEGAVPSSYVTGPVQGYSSERAGLTCPTVTFCAEAENVTSQDPSLPNLVHQAYVAMWDGTTWTETNVFPDAPTFGGSEPDFAGSQEVTITSLACTSSTFCVAGGFYAETTTPAETCALEEDQDIFEPDCAYLQYAFVSDWDGTSWTPVVLASDLQTYPNAAVTSIDCTSTTFCVAGGYYSNLTDPLYTGANANCGSPSDLFTDDSDSNDDCMQAFVAMWNGSTWEDQEVAGALNVGENTSAGLPGQYGEVSDISCTSSSFCVAGGQYSDADGTESFVSTWDGTTWTDSELAADLFPSDGPLHEGAVTNVDCTSTTFCMVLGYAYSGSYVATWNGMTWSDDVLSGDGLTAGEVYAQDLSCPTSTFCLAGVADADGAEVAVWSDGSWSAQSVFSPFDFENEPPTGQSITGVSCASASVCAVSGVFEYSYPSPDPNESIDASVPVVADWDGSTWTEQQLLSVDTNDSVQAISGAGGAASAVSCVSTLCVAAGSSDVPSNVDDAGMYSYPETFASVGTMAPESAPYAPTNVVAVAGDMSAQVSFAAPFDGNSTITGYTITASDGTNPANGGQTCVWTSGPLTCTVTGLTNGDSYSFDVTATNDIGTSIASAWSNTVVPDSVPGPPSNVVATPGPGPASATVTWNPSSDTGTPIIAYTVTATDSTNPINGGQQCVWTTGPLTCTVFGLSVGDSYTFTVTATNGIGTGSPSATSNAVTPAAAPSAPTAVVATAGNASARVTWNPASANGSAITAYTVTSHDTTNPLHGGQHCTWHSGPLTCTVTGLSNGDDYFFTVTATNGVSTGTISASSNTVVPATVPSSPTSVTLTPGNTTLRVKWVAPTSNGGASISGYTATLTPGGKSCSTTGASSTSCTVSGLTNGTAYRATVTAANHLGSSSPSSPSNSAIPGTPGPPTSLSAQHHSHELTVSWSAPSPNGTSAITSYTATASPGGRHCSSTVTHCTITGLTNGTAYTITVVAKNSVGLSPSSSAVIATPLTTPSAPTLQSAAAGNKTITVTFVAPGSNGGSAITGYVASAKHGSSVFTCSASGGATTCTISGLTNGTVYTVTVVAVNAAGKSPPSNSRTAIPVA